MSDRRDSDDHGTVGAFDVVDDETSGAFEAISGGRELGAITYDLVPDETRLVLRATSVFPEFRGHGVATELIRRVLDEVRSRGMTATIMCPIVGAFVESHPDYADIVDPEHPGVARHATRRRS